jgi:hypothetical protein
MPGDGMNLTLMNFGVTGAVRLLHPANAGQAPPLPGRLWLHVTAKESGLDCRQPLLETGAPWTWADDSRSVRLGWATEAPERFLAIATIADSSPQQRVLPGDLHDDWAPFNPESTGAGTPRMNSQPTPEDRQSGNPWAAAVDSNPVFWRRSPETWEWGYVELPVLDSSLSGQTVRL